MVLNTTLFKNTYEEEDGILTNTLSGRYENNRVVTLASYAFYNQLHITELILPHAKNINQYACANLSNCSHIELDWSNITTINQYAFRSCSLWTDSINCNATTIGSYAFLGCSKLITVNFPSATSVYQYAFQNCTGLLEASLTAQLTFTSSYLFVGCTNLVSVTLGCAHILRLYMFSGCTHLENVSVPKATGAELRCFQNCSSLKFLNMPSGVYVYLSAFWSCFSLQTLILQGYSSSGTISANAFLNCYNLLSLYLLGSLVKPLANANAFSNTPISTYTTSTGGIHGSIYVPSSLYASYIAATNWTTYAARFVSMTDLEIENFLSSVINIEAEFNQGNNIIYSTDTLDSLKQYLTVTAQLIGGPLVVPSANYTLSGSLSAVVNTITVSYSGKTATFEVIPRAGLLPSGYTEVKYIESTKGEGGLTYINTTYQIDKDKTILYIKSETIERNFGWFCADGSDGQTYGNYCNNGMGYYFSYGGASFGYGVASFGYNDTVAAPAFSGLETEYSYPDKYVKNRTSGYVYNISPDLNYGTPNGSNQNVLIFARYGWNTSRNGFSTSDIKCYNAKIGELNTIVRDFVPCIRESDGEIGMYDVAGSTCPLTNTSFYPNAGSGEFTYEAL